MEDLRLKPSSSESETSVCSSTDFIAVMQPLGLAPQGIPCRDQRAEAVQAGGWVSPGDGWDLPGDCSADGAAEVRKGMGRGIKSSGDSSQPWWEVSVGGWWFSW